MPTIHERFGKLEDVDKFILLSLNNSKTAPNQYEGSFAKASDAIEHAVETLGQQDWIIIHRDTIETVVTHEDCAKVED